MTGKGEKRFRFLKALLICLVLATAINGTSNLMQGPNWNPEYWPYAPSHLSDIATGIGTSAIGYFLIYLMFVGVAAAVRKLKGTDIGASDEASETASDAASEGKTWAVMKLKNLNGWQRLWVVVSVAWLLFVVIAFLVEGVIPTTGQLEARLERDTTDLQREWALATIEAARVASSAGEDLTAADIRSAYKDLSDAKIVERVHSSFPSVNYEPADSDHQQKLDRLQTSHQVKLDGLVSSQAKGVVAILLAWLVPSAGVYLLAWGGWRVVLWVWCGFKKGESNE